MTQHCTLLELVGAGEFASSTRDHTNGISQTQWRDERFVPSQYCTASRCNEHWQFMNVFKAKKHNDNSRKTKLFPHIAGARKKELNSAIFC